MPANASFLDVHFWLVLGTLLCVLGLLVVAGLVMTRANRGWLDQERATLPSASSVASLDDYRRAFAKRAQDERMPYERHCACEGCGAPIQLHPEADLNAGVLYRCASGHAWVERRGRMFIDFVRAPRLDVVPFRHRAESSSRVHGGDVA